MSRLAWALVLAFVAHLALFLVQMPQQKQAQLTFAGSDQVSVRLVHSRPEPDPLPVPVIEQEFEKMEVSEAVEKTAAPPVLPPVETTKEKEIKDAGKIKKVERKAVPVLKEKTAVPQSTPAVDVRKLKVAEPVPSVPTADGPESAGSASPARSAIRQAEPLAAENKPPVYPELARRRGWQGTVMLEVDVDRKGLVKAVQIQTSSSYALLDREALAAARKWRFAPGSRNGEPIPSKVLVPVHFILQGK